MDKQKNILNNRYIIFLSEHVDIIYFIFSMFLIELAFRWRIGMDLIKARNLLFNLSAILVLSGFLSIFKKKGRMIGEGIVVFLTAVYAFTQRFHYSFFNLFYSFQKLMLLSELNGVAESVIGKLAKRDLIFLLPVLFFIFCCIQTEKVKKNNLFFVRENRTLSVRIVLVFVFFLSGIGLNSWLKATFPEAESWSLNDEYNYQNLANKNRAIDEFGLLTYSYLDTKNVASVFLFNNNEEEIISINAELKDIRPDLSDNEYTGIFKDKNLILIQAESLSNYALNEAYMPVLSQMAKEGLSFTNHYAPMYQSATADTEFIGQTSLIPSIDYGSTAYTFHRNQYPYSLANQFSNMGYDVNSFHSYLRVF